MKKLKEYLHSESFLAGVILLLICAAFVVAMIVSDKIYDYVVGDKAKFFILLLTVIILSVSITYYKTKNKFKGDDNEKT